MDQNLSQLKTARSYPEFAALMTHGGSCSTCRAGTLCPKGTRLMAAWESCRPWREREAA
ncbi:hypothetical protein OG897_06090 [Streptomyces sp. NBC_00237]|uniref:hypothetical protein n=1 Tax=Streptomyces sp. NBC_00237 TaxID=2975687 RepID=UPI00225613B4|nr:hypothetical protein [Streptomyces sp. NBC_00237]MCX5201031.1 hypothetical protein [Streptomyces sp. NBC_00237]